MGVNHLRNWETVPLKIYKLRQHNKSPLWQYRVMTWHLQMHGCSILWAPQIVFLSWPDFQWTKPESEGAKWYEVTYSRPKWAPGLTCCPGSGVCFRSSVSLWWFKCFFVSLLFMECYHVDGDMIHIHGRLSLIVRKLILRPKSLVISLQKTRKVIRWNTPQK
jgi:hypothetical protein